MLSEVITKLAEETRQIKVKIANKIKEARPAPRGLWFTITIRQIAENDFILAVDYYNTHRQLTYLADYVENTDRSLETIFNTFKTVVETGRASPFKGILFNKETRTLLRGLL